MKNKCCICRDNKNALFYKKVLSYVLLKCPRCHLVYLDEISNQGDDFIETAKAGIDKMNEKERIEYWSFPHLYEKYKDIFYYYFNERLNRILQFKPEVKSLFDVGCGYGFWLKFCQDKGIEVEGVDISEEAVSYAKEVLNLEVERATLENYKFERTYEAIVICDLLEHLGEPNSQLEKINQALRENGILFIQVPNLLGFKLPPFHGFGLPYHIWQFDISTLRMLLTNHGFKILKWWTGIMGVIGVYQSGGPRTYHNIMWGLAKKLRVGNRLMVVAKKVL